MKTFKLNIKLSSFIEFKLRDKKLKDGKTSIADEKITINILYVTSTYSKIEISMNSNVFEFVKADKNTHSDFLANNGLSHAVEETASITLSAKDITVHKDDTLATFALCGEEIKQAICNTDAFEQSTTKKKLPTKINRSAAQSIYQEVMRFEVNETNLLEQEKEIIAILAKTKSALASQQLSRTMNEDLIDVATAFSYFLEQCEILKSR